MVSAEAVQWFVDRDQRTFDQSISFVPWVIRKGIRNGTVTDSTNSVVVLRGEGAVVFCDASGFTKLTEYLNQKPNGAELLSSVMNQFFTPLIEIISAYRGDIIKFSGDALTILFLAESEPDDPTAGLSCGSGWANCSGHSDAELAVLRAVACSTEIHKRLDNFDTGFSDKKLSFHIGIGCGACAVLHLGGEASPQDTKTRRFEYVLAGEPLEQIAHACKYAQIYETVLSPQAWALVKDTVIEGDVIEEDLAYKRLAGLVTTKHTFATIKAAAQARDRRMETELLQLSELHLTRRYIPSAVFQQMANGTLEYVNEIRNVTAFFICVSGLDVASPEGAVVAQDLMCSVQQACFVQEGQVNKFLVDDKGLLFLCVFGTPPMVHTDDPLRAIHACFAIIHAVKRLGLIANFGLSTGRVFCGMVGSSARQEYTTLGDSVNLAARLMQLGHANVVIVDQATYEQTKLDLDFTVMDPVVLKGKALPVNVFEPRVKQVVGSIVATNEPWMDASFGSEGLGSALATARAVVTSEVQTDPLLECSQWRELKLTQRCVVTHGLTSSGGSIVFGGASGLGKDQLCEYVVGAARANDKSTVTVYATDHGLQKDRARPIIELIETCLSVVASCGICKLESAGFSNKLELLARLIEEPLEAILEGAVLSEDSGMIDMPFLNTYAAGTMAEETEGTQVPLCPTRARTRKLSRFLSLREDVGKPLSAREMDVPFEAQFIDYCERLIRLILRVRPVVLVMRISRGTSLFNVVHNPTFWSLAKRMSEISHQGTAEHPFSVVVLCRKVQEAGALDQAHVVEMQPLTRNVIEEYVGKVLRIAAEDANLIPPELVDFIQELTQGNPLYVIETLDQLVSREFVTRSFTGHITINADLMQDVNVSDWSHTAMVGRVICQLEALAPQEAAIVKMASVFDGPFSVLDVAASLKSPYLNAQRFDNYRMYRTCAKLVRMGILSEIQEMCADGGVAVNDMSRFPKETEPKFIACMKAIPMFTLENLLIRKVARGMLLHQQALKVKRQALMHRVIYKDVPERVKEHRKRLETIHVPYHDLVKL